MINNNTERIKVIVIGGGQAGLSMGYYLAKSNLSFVILDASERIGDSWRKRWDTLHLFTPARYDSLPGLPFPAPPHSFPTKDDMGNYLEQYAKHFKLPVRLGIKVDALCREGNHYRIKAGDLQFEAEQVIVAMSDLQYPKIPSFAKELDPGIVQMHSIDYKNLSQLQEGTVLVVGAGNSGAEIALEAAKSHPVLLSGRDTGHVPFNIESRMAKFFLLSFVLRFLFHRVLTTHTFIGRKARPKATSMGGPLIRIKPKQLSTAGIKRVPRLTGIKDGKPVVDKTEVLEVKNIVWCTGYYPRFSWIDIPVFKDQEPAQNRGVVLNERGLYFLGLHFLYAFSSVMVHGVARDAKYIAKVVKRNYGNSSGIQTEKVNDLTEVYSG